MTLLGLERWMWTMVASLALGSFAFWWATIPQATSDLWIHATMVAWYQDLLHHGQIWGYQRACGLGFDATAFYGTVLLMAMAGLADVLAWFGQAEPHLLAVKLSMAVGLTLIPPALAFAMHGWVGGGSGSRMDYVRRIDVATGLAVTTWFALPPDPFCTFIGLPSFSLGLAANWVALPLWLVVVGLVGSIWRRPPEAGWRPWPGLALGIGVLLNLHAVTALAGLAAMAPLVLVSLRRTCVTGALALAVGAPALVAVAMAKTDALPLDMYLALPAMDLFSRMIYFTIDLTTAPATFLLLLAGLLVIGRLRKSGPAPYLWLSILGVAGFLALGGILGVQMLLPAGSQPSRYHDYATVICLVAAGAVIAEGRGRSSLLHLVVSSMVQLGFDGVRVLRWFRRPPRFTTGLGYLAITMTVLCTFGWTMHHIDELPRRAQPDGPCPERLVLVSEDDAALPERWWALATVHRFGRGASVNLHNFVTPKLVPASMGSYDALDRAKTGASGAGAALRDLGTTHIAIGDPRTMRGSAGWLRSDGQANPFAGWAEPLPSIPSLPDAPIPAGSLWWRVSDPVPEIEPAIVLPCLDSSGNPIDPRWQVLIAEAWSLVLTERAGIPATRLELVDLPIAGAEQLPVSGRPARLNVGNHFPGKAQYDWYLGRLATTIDRVLPPAERSPDPAAAPRVSWSSTAVHIEGLTPGRPYLWRTAWSRRLHSDQAELSPEAAGFIILRPRQTAVTIRLAERPVGLLLAIALAVSAGVACLAFWASPGTPRSGRIVCDAGGRS